jgi:alpha-1,3-fucosyltransferase 10
VGATTYSAGPVRSQQILILFRNPFFDDWPSLPIECSAPATFTIDQGALADADAVVFHIPSLPDSEMPTKRAGQLWIAWSMESRVMCPRLADQKFMAQFDLTMTYERASDVWVPYLDVGIESGLAQSIAPKTAPSPIVYLQSNPNDRCGRMAYAAEVMKVVRVDSFGQVHRNQTIPIAAGWPARRELYRNYKFTLAFENSIVTDYVTEKFFEPLIAGSVPVYRGAAEVGDLAPAPDCYVDVGNFASARELGRYLNHLDSNDDEYLSYQAWRTSGLSEQFEAVLANLRTGTFCRLAEVVWSRVIGDESGP